MAAKKSRPATTHVRPSRKRAWASKSSPTVAVALNKIVKPFDPIDELLASIGNTVRNGVASGLATINASTVTSASIGGDGNAQSVDFSTDKLLAQPTRAQMSSYDRMVQGLRELHDNIDALVNKAQLVMMATVPTSPYGNQNAAPLAADRSPLGYAVDLLSHANGRLISLTDAIDL